VTASITVTATPSATPSTSATYTVSPTGSASSTVSPTPSCSATVTLTATRSVTATVSPTYAAMAVGAGQFFSYPNPIKGKQLWFYYACQAPAQVTIDIVNVAGEKIASLTDTPAASGTARISWDASKLAPGIYLYRARIEDADGVRTFSWQKIAVVK
ncbi:MAG: T9SS type A sorting domain-containing protein, partial [Candidatus Firestonebacteria bacterium]|nr:T9SS type A sorting domain-containing protein [Candidatus Firestonebacteria bacterium]